MILQKDKKEILEFFHNRKLTENWYMISDTMLSNITLKEEPDSSIYDQKILEHAFIRWRLAKLEKTEIKVP